MRVLDSKPIGVATMGRKKQKLKKSLNSQNDDIDEIEVSGVQCSHVKRSININAVKKSLKHPIVIGRCQMCHGSNDSMHKKLLKNNDGSSCGNDASSISSEIPVDHKPSVYLCLQCGVQGCDQFSPEKHGVQHFQATQSQPHNIVLDVTSYKAWCFACDNYVPLNGAKSLQDCADFVYRAAGHKDSVTSYLKQIEGVKENELTVGSLNQDPQDVACAVSKAERNSNRMANLTSSVLLSFPKVKGLNNLGNTCFFNAVVQNLGQTHLFENQLSEVCRKSHSIDLCASSIEEESGSSEDDERNSEDEEKDEQKSRKPELLSLSLGDSGPLTQSVLNLFDEMNTSSGKQSSVSPNALFGQVCKKAPRFKGYQQQDSHELLRHLLDGMKAEEIKRSQIAILKAFKLPENSKSKDVPEDVLPKVKAYGREAKHTFIDSVFGGHFISAVTCEECSTPHHIFESFLDISLPVTDEKSCKSSGSRGTKSKGTASEINPGSTDLVEISYGKNKKQSKHMTKKERKALRKKPAKTNKKMAMDTNDHSESNLDSGNTELQSVVSATEMEKTKEDEGAGDSEEEPGTLEDDQEQKVVANENGDTEEIALMVSSSNETQEQGAENSNENTLNHHFDEQMHSNKLEGDAKKEERCDGHIPNGEFHSSSLETSDAEIEDSTESDNSKHQGDVDAISPPALEVQPMEEHITSPDENSNPYDNQIMLDSISVNVKNSGEFDEDSRETLNDCDGMNGEKRLDNLTDGVRSLNVSFSELSSSTGKLENCLPSTSSNEVVRAAMKTLGTREKQPGPECTVLSSLYQFTSHEMMHGNNMYCCSVCNMKGKAKSAHGGQKPVFTCATRQCLIVSPPAVLTLHLKRFQQVGYNLRKITEHIEFSETLDLAPFCSSLCQNIKRGQRRILYSLFGVVEHSGSLRSGHYTAYVKVRHSNPNAKRFLQTLTSKKLTISVLEGTLRAMAFANECEVDEPNVSSGKWYYISDSHVSEVKNVSSVLNCQAYMLFYERIE